MMAAENDGQPPPPPATEPVPEPAASARGERCGDDAPMSAEAGGGSCQRSGAAGANAGAARAGPDVPPELAPGFRARFGGCTTIEFGTPFVELRAAGLPPLNTSAMAAAIARHAAVEPSRGKSTRGGWHSSDLLHWGVRACVRGISVCYVCQLRLLRDMPMPAWTDTDGCPSWIDADGSVSVQTGIGISHNIGVACCGGWRRAREQRAQQCSHPCMHAHRSAREMPPRSPVC